MNNNILFKEFKAMIREISSGKNAHQLFQYLRLNNFSKLELMIVDSVIKNMPLENLNKTLILSKNNYYSLLQNMTFKLFDLYHSETTQNNNTINQ